MLATFEMLPVTADTSLSRCLVPCALGWHEDSQALVGNVPTTAVLENRGTDAGSSCT